MAADDGSERRTEDRVGMALILVVDDSTAIRHILRRTLVGAGYRVDEATDGLAALAACRAEHPDLVLLDMDMPVMDGPTALVAMRQDEALADIPVLFLTARTTGAEVAAGLRLGAQDYIRKPCEPAELEARVANALQQKGERDTFARMAAEADRLSTFDALTGLGNRRLLGDRVDALVAAAGPETPIGVVMVDIDHFKNVNDAEGHLVGDLVLRILSARMGMVVDPPAVLVRWGGEEFVVLQPQLRDDAQLSDLGELLRVAVAATPFAIGGGRVLPITISVGGASGRIGGFAVCLKLADEALYAAKAAGRNRMIIHSPA